MVDLLVLTSSDQLLFTLKLYLSFFTKRYILMSKSIVLGPPVKLSREVLLKGKAQYIDLLVLNSFEQISL
jgi:hypothetical protein